MDVTIQIIPRSFQNGVTSVEHTVLDSTIINYLLTQIVDPFTLEPRVYSCKIITVDSL